MISPRLYLSPPHMTGVERALVDDVFESNWVAPVGPHLDRFERRVAEYVGVQHAVAVSSGTAALHLALRHLGVGPGDEVLCSTLTFCASANPIMYQGAEPIFIDSRLADWNLDPQLLEDELASCEDRGRLPKAVVVVDLFGQGADLDAINTIAAHRGVAVIEDAAESLGATYRDAPVGNAAWASFFSFNGNKIITSGGGGMLCSDDEELISHARRLATQSREPAPHYQHTEIGYNYRLSNVSAAIGLAQMDSLDEFVRLRRRNFDWYEQHLGALPGISMMPEPPLTRSSRWLSAVRIDEAAFGASSREIRLALEAENIESRPIWKPLHLQPSFAGCRSRGGAVAESLFANGLCLPSGSSMTEEDLGRVCRTIRSLARRRGRRAA